MCRAAGLAVNGTLLVLVMGIIALFCMAFGGYAVKFYQNAFDTTQITGEEFREYSWELSLYFTAAVEGAIVCFLLVFFVLCNAFDACWMCTQCCCTHFVCTPLVHHCCLGGSGGGESPPYNRQYNASPHTLPQHHRYRFAHEEPLDMREMTAVVS